ncbi:MAG: hypothetical protein F6K14_11115 [Symploca sp. SIO2C1]|nr:hypothetical protein [Symploca sp. SIO2C1]
MNLRFLPRILTIVALTLLTNIIFTQPSYAQSTTFECEKDLILDELGIDDYKTIARTPRGEFPIILWVSRDFERFTNRWGKPYDAMTRCMEVSRRIQDYYNCDLLDPKYISGATIPWTRDGKTEVYPVVVVTHPEVSECSSLPFQLDAPIVKGLLFMLPPEEDYNSAANQLRKILEKLEDIRNNSGLPSIEPICN